MNALANLAKMKAPVLILSMAIHVSVLADSRESIANQVRLSSFLSDHSKFDSHKFHCNSYDFESRPHYVRLCNTH